MVRDHGVLRWVLHFVGLVHHYRHLFPRSGMELVLARAGLGSASGRGADQRRSAVHVWVPRLPGVGDFRIVPDSRLLRGRIRRALFMDTIAARERSVVGIPGRRSRDYPEVGPGAIWNPRLPAARDGRRVYEHS